MCPCALFFRRILSPTHVRWKNDPVCMTRLRTGEATVQWKVDVGGDCRNWNCGVHACRHSPSTAATTVVGVRQLIFDVTTSCSLSRGTPLSPVTLLWCNSNPCKNEGVVHEFTVPTGIDRVCPRAVARSKAARCRWRSSKHLREIALLNSWVTFNAVRIRVEPPTRSSSWTLRLSIQLSRRHFFTRLVQLLKLCFRQQEREINAIEKGSQSINKSHLRGARSHCVLRQTDLWWVDTFVAVELLS